MLPTIATRVIDAYKDQYPELSALKEQIQQTLSGEEEKFRKTLASGIKEFNKLVEKGDISGKDAFILFSTYGFPLELTLELALEQDDSFFPTRYDEPRKKT